MLIGDVFISYDR